MQMQTVLRTDRKVLVSAGAPLDTDSRAAAKVIRMTVAPTHETPRWVVVVESLAAFLMGVLLMAWIYSGTGGVNGSELGLPENDSGYHVRMAAMLPQVGLLKTFPWLQFVWFRDAGDDFVSHHYGFHILLLPFILLANTLGANEMAGGRWAITCYFGVTLMLFNLLLIAGNVRWRWLWLAIFLLLPSQFFLRHAYVRAICPSLMIMLLLVLMVVKNRPFWAGVAVLAYTHLYLGGVLYAPIMLVLYAIAKVLGPVGDRRPPWKLAAYTAGAWALGIVTYPYAGGMYEFLKMQVLGSGLNPDIEVGQEWRSYTPAWFVVSELAPVILTVWTFAVIARFRAGPPLNSNEAWLLLCNFAFLVLMLKARRFVEYWPAFAFLSAAYLLAPLQSQLVAWFQRGTSLDAERRPRDARFFVALAGAPVACAIVALSLRPLAKAFLPVDAAGWPTGVTTEHWQLGAFAFVFVLSPTLINVGLGLSHNTVRTAMRMGLAGLIGSSTALAAAGAIGGPSLKGVRNEIRCPYNLDAIRKMMAFIKEHSQPGEVIFTDDWDTFPIFFYHNTHNYYIVGLDPKFTHARRPDLWNRYVCITRGQAPEDKYAEVPQPDGTRKRERIKIRLTDIRDHFHAQWVICDRDHRSLANQLEKATDFAELVYPARKMADAQGAEYVVFRIRDAADTPRSSSRSATAEFDRNGILYLSDLSPVHATQGYGELQADAEVEGGKIELKSRRFLRGLGTHAPSELEFDVPPGAERFEATVGIDASQVDCGSAVVSILVDGRQMLRSQTLRSESTPLDVRISVAGAKRITLKADPTSDGNRCDHVDWASARFSREPPDSKPTETAGSRPAK